MATTTSTRGAARAHATRRDPGVEETLGATHGDAPPDAFPYLLGLVTVLSVFALGLGRALDDPLTLSFATAVFMLVGIGSAPWQFTRLAHLERAAFSGLTGVTAVIAISTGMLLAHQWHPVGILSVLVPLVTAVHAYRLTRGSWGSTLAWVRSWRLSPSGVPLRRSLTRGPALATFGAVLVLVSDLQHQHVSPDFFGFLRVVGPLWYLGLACVLAGVLSLRGDTGAGGWWTVLLLMLVLTMTPAIVYETARSASTAKHIELVQQIRRLGAIDSTVAVYNAWPSFFAGTAWFCDVSGIRDPYVLARFWPPAIGILRVSALAYLVRQVVPDRRWTWVGVALGVLADSIGADYFSPQSIGFVVGLTLFGLGLRLRERPWWPGTALLWCGAAALTVEHQLSPYIVSGVLLLLSLGRQVRWIESVPATLLTLTWTAINRSSLTGFLSIGSVGALGNFRPPVSTGSSTLARLPEVALSSRSLLAGVLLIGLLALAEVWRTRGQLRTWALAAAPSVGLVLIAINPYGNEGIFRATLFGIPWLVALGTRRLAAARRPLTGAVPLAAVLGTTFLIASFTLDPLFVLRAADIQAGPALQAAVTSGLRQPAVLVNLGNGDVPVSVSPETDRRLRTENRQGIKDPVVQEAHRPGADAVSRITGHLVRASGVPLGDASLYALWSPTFSIYDRAYAQQTQGQFEALRDAFVASRYWSVVYQRDGTVIFVFVPSRYLGSG